MVSFYAVASALIFDSLILFLLETLTDECRLEKLRIPLKSTEAQRLMNCFCFLSDSVYSAAFMNYLKLL